MISKELLLKYAADQGFHCGCVLTSTQIQQIFNHYKGNYSAVLAHIEREFTHSFHINLLSHDPGFTLLMCGLSCFRDKHNRPPDGVPDCGAFAPFAQKNYYAEAVQRLKTVFKEIRKKTGIIKKKGRIFCNSRAPEKFFAWASGLGGYGRNSLIIHKSLGSLFIIAGLLLFSPLPDSPDVNIPDFPGTLCGSCRACMDACPTGAITSPGIIDQSLCIQALSTRLIILPEGIKRAFGNRIYGCQVCQDVCPYNQDLGQETYTTRGGVGPWIPLKIFLEMSPVQLKNYFKKTVPGSSWIDMRALQRNALLAAGNLHCRSLLSLVKGYRKHPHPALSDAAAWAVKMICS